jgi:KUP system potassium uptake protein
MAGNPAGTPIALLHNLRHNKVLHDCVVILNVRIEEVPHVPASERFSIDCLDSGFWRMSLRFGFMDEPNVPAALDQICGTEFEFNPERASFFLGRESIRCDSGSGLRRWRYQLFAWMSQNARDATSFFSLPQNRVVELGTQISV